MVSGLFHPVSELTFMVGVLQISESGGRTHLYQVLVVLNSLVLKALSTTFGMSTTFGIKYFSKTSDRNNYAIFSAYQPNISFSKRHFERELSLVSLRIK